VRKKRKPGKRGMSLKTATESLLRTVSSGIQTAGAEHRNARFANDIVVEG